MNKTLKDRVALVTGGSGRVGGGVAEGLAEAVATVYFTARTLNQTSKTPGTVGSLDETAERINQIGGKAFPIQCDHTNDVQVRDVFRSIERAQGRLDILVNAVWGGYKHLRAEGKDRMTMPPQCFLGHSADLQ
jgi:NAD(P)-dependent dehydrogenase (short-subunit alcohol dehydrogenase family)